MSTKDTWIHMENYGKNSAFRRFCYVFHVKIQSVLGLQFHGQNNQPESTGDLGICRWELNMELSCNIIYLGFLERMVPPRIVPFGEYIYMFFVGKPRVWRSPIFSQLKSEGRNHLIWTVLTGENSKSCTSLKHLVAQKYRLTPGYVSCNASLGHFTHPQFSMDMKCPNQAVLRCAAEVNCWAFLAPMTSNSEDPQIDCLCGLCSRAHT